MVMVRSDIPQTIEDRFEGQDRGEAGLGQANEWSRKRRRRICSSLRQQSLQQFAGFPRFHFPSTDTVE
jgi:hypothetical protein